MAEIAKYLDAEKVYQYIKKTQLIQDNAKGAVFEDLQSCASCEEDLYPVAHGRWVRYGAEKWYCSECMLTIEAEKESLPDFCKACGAKMDGESQ